MLTTKRKQKILRKKTKFEKIISYWISTTRFDVSLNLKMKILSIILLLFIIISCDNVNENFIEHKITLDNNLGTIVINLPKDFDTTYRTTEYSDYTNDEIICHYYSTREAANLKYNYSGIEYNTDSLEVYSLFISQPKNNRQNIDSNLLLQYSKLSSTITFLDFDNVVVLKHENIKFNGRLYYIVGTMLKVENKTSWILYAQTTIKNQIIILVYQRLTKSNTSCFKELFESIKSIKVEK